MRALAIQTGSLCLLIGVVLLDLLGHPYAAVVAYPWLVLLVLLGGRMSLVLVMRKKSR
jgi:hypothetical protein